MTCDETTLAILQASVNSIEEELGPSPEGVYASVRTRLDILEARINNPYAPAPSVNNPFFIGNSGVTIQDGYGDPSSQQVPATPGSLFLREDGYNVQGLYAFRPDGQWHQIDTDPFTAAGDLSGNSYTQTVIGIQSRPVSSAAPTTGNTLGWTGSAWAPSSLNIAGGAGYVTGQLPPANMGTITLTGDVTGAASGGSVPTTVGKIQGNTVTSGALTEGQFFVATSTSNWAATTLSGDITESSVIPGKLTVININGTSVPATPSANTVLVATSGTSSVWQQIVDAQVSASAAIQGSKVVPNFVAQNIATTGNINVATMMASGNVMVTGNVDGYSTVLGGSLSWLPTGSSPNFGPSASVVMPSNASYVIPETQYNSYTMNVTSFVTLTTTQNLVLPYVNGSTWLIANNTTGGASLHIVGNPVTVGPTVLSGTSALVWTDGVNFYGVNLLSS
jgi:hypothetical protein